jgi:alkylhydroperoxidase family enzyme
MEVAKTSIDPALKHLIDIRVAAERLYLLSGYAFERGQNCRRTRAAPVPSGGWRESPLFSAREKAALAFTEALTQIGVHGVSDALAPQRGGALLGR